jgi:hypothetical protein
MGSRVDGVGVEQTVACGAVACRCRQTNTCRTCAAKHTAAKRVWTRTCGPIHGAKHTCERMVKTQTRTTPRSDVPAVEGVRGHTGGLVGRRGGGWLGRRGVVDRHGQRGVRGRNWGERELAWARGCVGAWVRGPGWLAGLLDR